MAGFQLEMSHGGRVRRLSVASPTVTIGRSPDCDLVVPFPWVAPRHVILQLDPPFVRAKSASAGAAVLVGETPLRNEWSKLQPGALLRVPSNDGGPLLIRVQAGDGTAAELRPRLLEAGGGDDGRPDDFGVIYATESPFEGQRGWLDTDATAPGETASAVAAPATAGASSPPVSRPRRSPGRTIGVVAGAMGVLIASAAAFSTVRASVRRARVSADVDLVYASVNRARDLLDKKQYAAAKVELDKARAAAVKWPALEDKVAEIDGLNNLPAIRFGAAGYELEESQWLPADTARAWREARARDDPRIKALEAEAAAAGAAGRWDEGRVACEEALALMDAEPVKSHPRRGPVQTLLTRLKNEAVRDEMTARGLVLYEDKWVTPQEKERLELTARGMVQYKGKWMTREQAFTAEQTEKGLVL